MHGCNALRRKQEKLESVLIKRTVEGRDSIKELAANCDLPRGNFCEKSRLQEVPRASEGTF